jgi:hypothetical protein
MQLETVETRVFQLTLTQEEVNWLHNAMQNPIAGVHPHQEDDEERKMRLNFFGASFLF